MIRYVYVIFTQDGSTEVFSSSKKAIKFCIDNGYKTLNYSFDYVSEYKDNYGDSLLINKEIVK